LRKPELKICTDKTSIIVPNTNRNKNPGYANWSEAEIPEGNSIRPLKNKLFTDEKQIDLLLGDHNLRTDPVSDGHYFVLLHHDCFGSNWPAPGFQYAVNSTSSRRK